jgi:Flp pilus assembly protein TadD
LSRVLTVVEIKAGTSVGSRALPVSPPEQNADALFEQAQAAEEAGDIAEAKRLYRALMKCDPTDAAPRFNLGNMSGLTVAR